MGLNQYAARSVLLFDALCKGFYDRFLQMWRQLWNMEQLHVLTVPAVPCTGTVQRGSKCMKDKGKKWPFIRMFYVLIYRHSRAPLRNIKK